MKDELPILMKGEMVRALLDGRKTMTRRVINPQPTRLISAGKAHCWLEPSYHSHTWKCPYGKKGTLLYVKETWAAEFIGYVIK